MKQIENHQGRFDELLDQYLLGCLTAPDEAEFTELLGLHRELRDRFREATMVDAELRSLSGDSTIAVAKRGTNLRWLVIPALAAAVMVMVAGMWWTRMQPKVSPTNVVATLVVSFDDQFANEQMPIEGNFVAGDYHLIAGAVTMRFENGVEVSMQSPAKYTIVDAMHMRLDLGRARAIVPESGHGFVISTANMQVEDLGTEFGVVVDEADRSELHVFAGEVQLHQKGQPGELLTEDMAIAWDQDGRHALSRTASQGFATRTDIGYQQWLRHSNELRRDPDAVLYFDFEVEPDNDRVLKNRVSSTTSPTNGVIRGCYWASGRWPDKGALLLENAGDRVELDIPGSYDAVTMMAWIQVNRFDNALQTFFNTNDWQPGEHHWNLMRDGAFRVGVSEGYTITCNESPVPLGRWSHLAAVLDRKLGIATYFLNGNPVASEEWSGSDPIVFGPSTIGAFGSTLDDEADEIYYNRELRGRIDELSLFKRAMTEDEIRSSFTIGSMFE
ncbi:FecR protein [Rubripirellula amarantea]|uniref:FecR protein n=1 Tax=Rubripirellula amarantea TaxID=2527999 RepID=A0A5C5WW87_9BACT|nr:LamG-like jellyroll fold domain-containing protein [Rubripirellula amarantea]TWT54957.1 FecR protein [Rubripirellula amarantea]